MVWGRRFCLVRAISEIGSDFEVKVLTSLHERRAESNNLVVFPGNIGHSVGKRYTFLNRETKLSG